MFTIIIPIDVLNFKMYSNAFGVFTCLRCYNKSSVALVVLPVNIKIRALREGDDHIHVAMVARHNQARLKHKERALISHVFYKNVKKDIRSARVSHTAVWVLCLRYR